MRIVCDIEANGLENPSKIWVIVCKDIDTGDYTIFREPVVSLEQRLEFLTFASKVTLWIGHNFLEYDFPVLQRLLGLQVEDIWSKTIDTLIISKLVNYSRPNGHSIEAYGEEFGLEKIKFNDFSKYSQEMEDYCVRDVDLCHRVYNHYSRIICDDTWSSAIRTEQEFQYVVVNALHDNGFAFNSERATKLLNSIEKDLHVLDKDIEEAFPPREVLIREFTPKLTKFGTISKSSVPRSLRDQIHTYEAGRTYKQTKMVPFNPSSPKQIITVLNEAKWSPVDKTKTHVETERILQRASYDKKASSQLDLNTLRAKLVQLKKYGWKVNENNLTTLPESAPSPARLLAKRILLESRRRTLTEWLSLVRADGRIHGKFYGIGAWTHRMAHQNPNTANIPTDAKLYGAEMRSLWRAGKKNLLVGVDAEGIQLRIFAHYINDPEFTRSLVEGKKDDKTDPHSLNARILGDKCKSRQTAKRFIYALLLGAGIGKLAEILECNRSDAEEALERLLRRYQGFAYLKKHILPADGRRGYFTGLDGRSVQIPGDTAGTRTHLCMSGYLQNGEAVVMKRACLLWHRLLREDKELLDFLWFLVNFVHDEWQTEVANNMRLAIKVAQTQADSLRMVGEELKLNCPLAGSYWNEDHGDYTIGVNWSVTH